jgi:hypothetical protein
MIMVFLPYGTGCVCHRSTFACAYVAPRWNSGTSYRYFALQKYAPAGKECVSSIFASVVGGLFECAHGVQIVRLERESQPEFTRHHPIAFGFVVCLIIPGNQLDGTMPLCDQQDRLIRIQADVARVDCPCCSECCPTWGREYHKPSMVKHDLAALTSSSVSFLRRAARFSANWGE